MASLKELFILTHSLNSTEKRYLSIFLKGTAGKSRENYEKQIDNILSLKEFNENRLKEKMKNISTKRFSEFNTNLFNFICKALIIQSENNVVQKLLKDALLSDILISRGLSSMAQKQVNKNIERYENYAFTDILAHYHKMNYKLGSINRVGIEEHINLLEKKLENAESYQSESEYQILSFKLSKLLMQHDTPRTKKQAKIFEEFLKNPLLQDFQKAKSNYAKHYFNMAKILLLATIWKVDEAIILAEKAFKFAHSAFDRKIDPIPETFILRRFLNLLLSTNRTDKLDFVIEKLTEMTDFLTDNNQKAAIWSNILDARLFSFIANKKYQEGIYYFENNAEKDFQGNLEKFTRLDATALLIARLYFLIGKYDKSIDYCNIAMDSHRYKFPSFLLAAKYLLMINFSMKEEFILLPHYINSLERNLKKLDVLYTPEKALLSLVKKIGDPNKKQQELKKFYNVLLKEKNNPFSSSFFGNGDYIDWVEKELN